MGGLYAEGALRNPHALLAADARALILRHGESTSESSVYAYKLADYFLCAHILALRNCSDVGFDFHALDRTEAQSPRPRGITD